MSTERETPAASVDGDEPDCSDCCHSVTDHDAEGCSVEDHDGFCACQTTSTDIWLAALRTVERERDVAVERYALDLEELLRVNASCRHRSPERISLANVLMRRDLSALRAQVAGLKQDKVRLDWLDANACGSIAAVLANIHRGRGISSLRVRDAIDAAMSVTPTENGHER